MSWSKCYWGYICFLLWFFLKAFLSSSSLNSSLPMHSRTTMCVLLIYRQMVLGSIPISALYLSLSKIPPYPFTFTFTYPINPEGRWGTTDDLLTSSLHPSLSSAALIASLIFKWVHSLMLSSHLIFCLPRLLPPCTVPCKMVFARPEDLVMCPYHLSFRLLTVVKKTYLLLNDLYLYCLAPTCSLMTCICTV